MKATSNKEPHLIMGILNASCIDKLINIIQLWKHNPNLWSLEFEMLELSRSVGLISSRSLVSKTYIAK